MVHFMMLIAAPTGIGVSLLLAFTTVKAVKALHRLTHEAEETMHVVQDYVIQLQNETRETVTNVNSLVSQIQTTIVDVNRPVIDALETVTKTTNNVNDLVDTMMLQSLRSSVVNTAKGTVKCAKRCFCPSKTKHDDLGEEQEDKQIQEHIHQELKKKMLLRARTITR
jgi:uncharacterized protein YoxC